MHVVTVSSALMSPSRTKADRLWTQTGMEAIHFAETSWFPVIWGLRFGMSVHLFLLLPEETNPGSIHAYRTLMQTVSCIVHSSGQTSKNGQGGSDVWRCLALLQVPITVGRSWKGVQRCRNAARSHTHMAGRIIGLASRVDGRNPKRELTGSRLSNWKLKTPEKDRGGGRWVAVAEMSLDRGGERSRCSLAFGHPKRGSSGDQ